MSHRDSIKMAGFYNNIRFLALVTILIKIRREKQMAKKPLFDKYAEDYDDIQKKSMGRLCEDVNIFAIHKIEILHRLLGNQNPQNILEFGCGTGRNLPHLEERFPNAKIFL